MVALMTLMNPLGTMVGFVLPLIFVNTGDKDEQIKTQFLYHLISQAISAGVILLLTVLFFKGDKEQRSSPFYEVEGKLPESVQFGTVATHDQ